MKSLRITALMFALGAFAITSLPAHAQQEVDPDHYDQPAAAPVQAKAAPKQHKAVANKQHKSNVKLASKQSQKPQPSASAPASASGQATAEAEAFGLASSK